MIEQFFDPLGKRVEQKKEKHDSRREEVENMIKNALVSGDATLLSAGKVPQYEPRALKQLFPSQAPTVPDWPSNPNAGGAQAALPVGSSEDADRNWIIQKESEGVPTAKNPNSSAFGLGQLIKANREAYAKRFGFSPDTIDPQEQLQMMDAYVKERYGSYANARKFWEQHNWY